MLQRGLKEQPSSLRGQLGRLGHGGKRPHECWRNGLSCPYPFSSQQGRDSSQRVSLEGLLVAVRTGKAGAGEMAQRVKFAVQA